MFIGFIFRIIVRKQRMKNNNPVNIYLLKVNIRNTRKRWNMFKVNNKRHQIDVIDVIPATWQLKNILGLIGDCTG